MGARVKKLTYPRKAEAQRKRWADPIYRERWIAGAKERWATPEHRAKMAAAGFTPATMIHRLLRAHYEIVAE